MNIFDRIETVHDNTPGWCSSLKANTLAALVIGTRPEITIEIGCFYGRSLLPMALAHQFIGKGSVIAIDPWMAEASVAGQLNPLDVEYWNRQQMHETAYAAFKAKVYELGLQNVVRIERKASDDFEPPEEISILHLDGNHGEQSVKDIQRYAPKIKRGGFLVADDLKWTGLFVEKAVSLLPDMGFVELYRIENESECWACFERVSFGAPGESYEQSLKKRNIVLPEK